MNVRSRILAGMPKVSEEHWRAQEQRFLDAARRCFTRVGIEAASMEEIRTEAEVSAGAMYRYFASKDDLVHAAIATSMAEFEQLVVDVGECQGADTPSGYLRLLLTSLRQFRHHSGGVDLFRLAIQGWAHAQSRPETKTMIKASLKRQLRAYQKAAESWSTTDNAPAAAIAIAGAVIGYVVQSAFSDSAIDPARYSRGLSQLA